LLQEKTTPPRRRFSGGILHNRKGKGARMSVLNTLPAPVIQMALVEKIVDAEQNQVEKREAATRSATRRDLRAKRSKVSATDAAEEKHRIEESDEEPTPEDRHARRGGPSGPDEDAGNAGPDEESSQTKPWTGHIVNIKI
jgi:hypothetical protein